MLGGLDMLASAGGGMLLGLIKAKIQANARIKELELTAQLKREGKEVDAALESQTNFKVDGGEGDEEICYLWGLYKVKRKQRDKAILPPHAYSIGFLSICLGLGLIVCFYLADVVVGPIADANAVTTTKFWIFERTAPVSSDSPRTMASIGREISLALVALLGVCWTGSKSR
jgi:hypothetical protein